MKVDLPAPLAPSRADPRTGMQVELDTAQYRAAFVADRDIVQAQQRVGDLVGLEDAEIEGRIDVGGRHRLHAFQLLQATLGLARLGGLGAETPHEGFDLGHAALLAQVHLLLLGEALCALHLEGRVVAAVQTQLLMFDVRDEGHHRIEKIAVVGDQQQGAGVALEPILQPLRGVEVEMVGGLVEQQQIARTHQGLGEIETDTPAAREFTHRPRAVGLAEAEAMQQLLGTVMGVIAVDMVEFGMRGGDARIVARGLGGAANARSWARSCWSPSIT
jgi:hypothetical protein